MKWIERTPAPLECNTTLLDVRWGRGKGDLLRAPSPMGRFVKIRRGVAAFSLGRNSV
jgi:hypothetical protein